MEIIKTIFATLLGAGKGLLGTGIRVAVAALAGWLASKGVDIDSGTITSLTDSLTAIGLAILAVIGSILNGNKPSA